MSETGIATTGMITPRTEPRKRKMTRMTMSSVSVRVLSTSSIAVWMYSDESYGTPMLIPAGNCARISGISARTRFMTSSVFAVGSTKTPMNTAFWPLKLTSWSYVSAPRTTSAMSPRRTRSLPFCFTTSCLNSPTVCRLVFATRLTEVIVPFVVPSAAR